MKFLNFLHQGQARLGIQLDDQHILDVAALYAGAPLVEGMPVPANVDALILAGDAAVATLAQRVQAGSLPASALLPYASTQILAPVAPTGKNIFCIGRNYREHIIESNLATGRPVDFVPEAIEIFTKPRTALVGHRAGVLRHAALTKSLDYEVELAIVIGKRGRDISRENALDHVFGYTIANDVTARDLQKRHGQWFKGKGLDTSCPLGPVIVHRSAIANPNDLTLELDVDGELRQRDNTSLTIFSVEAIIEQLSLGLTLEPGDVICTGTPKGVGFAFNPPRCLQVGQTMNARISGIGELSNTIID